MKGTDVNVNDWNLADPKNKGKNYKEMSKQILHEHYSNLAGEASKAKVTSEDK